MSRPLVPNDHVDINVPHGLRSHGRIDQLVPPNCARVFVIPQKYYALIKLEHLTLRTCEGPRNHNVPRQEELFEREPNATKQ